MRNQRQILVDLMALHEDASHYLKQRVRKHMLAEGALIHSIDKQVFNYKDSSQYTAGLGLPILICLSADISRAGPYTVRFDLFLGAPSEYLFINC